MTLNSQISFEVGSLCNIEMARQIYKELDANYVFVTWRPNEEISHLRQTCASLSNCGLDVVPHVVARNLSSSAEYQNLLQYLGRDLSIDTVALLAGDAPCASGPYTCVADLLTSESLQSYSINKVFIAGYPQGHRVLSPSELKQHLSKKIHLAKVQGLSIEIVTQLCSSVSAMVKWIEEAKSDYSLGMRASIPIGEDSKIQQQLERIYKGQISLEYNTHLKAGSLTYLKTVINEIKLARSVINLHLISFQDINILLDNTSKINAVLQSEL